MIVNREDRITDAEARNPAADPFRPIDLHLDRKQGLRIEWADGLVSRYSLADLRRNCPCATCRSEREQAVSKSSGLSLTILPSNIDRATLFADARLVGNYAIQITWQDGHSTGIYDFRYLRLMSPAGAASTGEAGRG